MRGGRPKQQPQAAPKPVQEEVDMKKEIAEFGDAAIVRHYCDRKGCGKPVTLLWKGRDGEYCSNKCLKLAERGVTNVTEATTTVEETDSPVTAGKKEKKAKAAPAAKGKTKKAVVTKAKGKVKAVKAKKAAAAESNGDYRDTINTRRVIKLIKKASPYKEDSKRDEVFKMIKSGMTVRDLQEAAIKHYDSPTWMNRAVAILRVCEADGLCSVSSGE
jgi:hypothetical protein